MVKIILTAVSFFAVACTADNQKQIPKVGYDELALKEFVFATHNPNNDKSAKRLDSLLADASKDSIVFSQTVAYLDEPFGSPNSAYRNDSLYVVLLEVSLKSPWIDSTVRETTKGHLHLVMQNQPGTVANDFTYESVSGIKKNLHDLKAKYTLLYFYNPECPACKEMKTALTSSATIVQKVNTGELIILALDYKDENVWLKHLDEMPKEWIHGRDQDEYLYKNKIYDLRAIPTLYLLDADKRVLLKDCMDIHKIEEHISR